MGLLNFLEVRSRLQRQTDVMSYWTLIGLQHRIVSPAVAIFVDVSYQSDLLGLSAGKGETSKFTHPNCLRFNATSHHGVFAFGRWKYNNVLFMLGTCIRHNR